MMAQCLVDHVVVVGAAPRLERSATSASATSWLDAAYTPSMLASFSPRAPLPPASAIAAFCAPAGLRVQREMAAPRFACFVLTQGDGTRLYGHCLTVHAQLSASTEVPLRVAEEEPADAAASATSSFATVGELLGHLKVCSVAS